MLSAFRWTAPGGATRDHVTGAATVALDVDGDSYQVLTDTGAETVLDVRGVWLVVAIDTAAPAGLAGADGGEGRPLRQVWLDLLAGDAVVWMPNASVPDVQIPVVPDLGHRATLYAVERGSLVTGDELRLRSRLLYAPDSPTLLDLAEASPYNPLTSSIIIGA